MNEGSALNVVLWTEHNRITEQLRSRIAELEAVIRDHGIPVKTYAGGEAHYVSPASHADTRRVMKMALEALEEAQKCVTENIYPDRLWGEQIAALREALK